jgi:hypothetical protein
MKNLLFFTAAALLLVESTFAYADPPSQNIMERGGKWSGSAVKRTSSPSN